jgi:hypothetical protein
MRRTTILALFLLAGPGLAPAASPFGALFDSRSARIQVRVLDDQGQPVDKASIGIGVTGGGDAGNAHGTTDTNGAFAARLRMVGSLYLRAEKPGYYRTSGEAWGGPVVGKTLPPTNLYTVVMKRILDPVPMIHRDVVLTVPVLDQPVAFDLEAGDWVAPHGKGARADFLARASKRFVSTDDMDIRLAIVFTNRGDGIQSFPSPQLLPGTISSDLLPPQIAPLSGYVTELTSYISRAPGQEMVASHGRGTSFLIRVRTVLDEKGEVLRANYGWTRGPVKVAGYHIPTVSTGFEYHFNPDPASRSLEPKRP